MDRPPGAGAAKNLRLHQASSMEWTMDELIGHFVQELGNTLCDILGTCELRREAEFNATWRDGNMVLLDTGWGQRSVGRIGFVVSME